MRAEPTRPGARQPAPEPSAQSLNLLRRPFRAIIFDWDGTAVVDRKEDARPLARLLERLSSAGVWVVIVTGTNFGNIDRQACQLISAEARHHLVVCANRGSEVFGFGPAGETVLLYRRTATAEEERKLTAIAEAVRDYVVSRTSLDVEIVYDRLNRRKIDLIPVPEWADPPKSAFRELLQAVESRLKDAGLAGGLREVVRAARRLSSKNGLPDARITSDIKHIEVGLTDKGDSLRWVKSELLPTEGIRMSEVLIAGDEFGAIAGFPGSDDLLHAAADDATVVSVGTEPSGVPAGVIHLGGGPPRFRTLLTQQFRIARGRTDGHQPPERPGRHPSPGRTARVDEMLDATIAPSWRMIDQGYEPAMEHEVESRLALSNGLLGVRASLEQPTLASRPRTYVAGAFDTPPIDSPVPGLVPAPNWPQIRLLVDGEPLSIERGETLEHTRILDYQRGVLRSRWAQRDEAGHTVYLDALRFASAAERSLACEVVRIEVERPAALHLETSLQAHRGLRLERMEPGVSVWRSTTGRSHIAVASSDTLRFDGQSVERENVEGGGAAWTWTAAPGQTAVVERVLAFARGLTAEEASWRAVEALGHARQQGIEDLYSEHVARWANRWLESDVEVYGSPQAQNGLRFAVYHLNAAANPADDFVSVGARALTGDAYMGHVFWDTEIYLLPFYTLTWPEAARAMLMYRYHTLPGARAKAEAFGYRGALYAWESTDTGEETTPRIAFGPDGRPVVIRSGVEEHHISADIAYAVWKFWRTTNDASFMLEAGAEILLETARFWASRAKLEDDGFYHIRDVIGPDEYHETIDDNVFTNYMARWNIHRGLETVQLLRKRWPDRWRALRESLNLSDDEMREWRAVADGIRILFNPDTGLYEQFDGFFQLDQVDLSAFADRTAPMDVVLGPEKTKKSQVVKQADVVMLLALLWDEFPDEVRRANFAYYEPRCGQGSSLSPPMHALVAARLCDLDIATRYFLETAAIDLDDTMGNAAGGVHIAALGGLWQAAILGFAGLTVQRDGLHLAPNLPGAWTGMRFPVSWRGRLIRVEVCRDPATVTATLERGRPVVLTVGGLRQRLGSKRPRVWRFEDGDWKETDE